MPSTGRPRIGYRPCGPPPSTQRARTAGSAARAPGTGQGCFPGGKTLVSPQCRPLGLPRSTPRRHTRNRSLEPRRPQPSMEAEGVHRRRNDHADPADDAPTAPTTRRGALEAGLAAAAAEEHMPASASRGGHACRSHDALAHVAAGEERVTERLLLATRRRHRRVRWIRVAGRGPTLPPDSCPGRPGGPSTASETVPATLRAPGPAPACAGSWRLPSFGRPRAGPGARRAMLAGAERRDA